MNIYKYMKILSRKEYFNTKINDDDIACIFLVDNYNAKSFIWTIESKGNELCLLSDIKVHYNKNLIKSLIVAPKMMIEDYIFNLIIKADVTLLKTVSKKDFLRFLGLYEWII